MMDYTDVLFDTDFLYAYIRDFAAANSLSQTLAALPFAAARHGGQYRDSKESVPYIVHPMQIAFHAIALGLIEDDLLAVCLLHDVCEDCGVSYIELPAGERVMKAVKLLTKEWDHDSKTDEAEQRYYDDIASDPTAAMVKLLDRCNNVSSMASAFSKKRIEKYVNETERFYRPLIRSMLNDYPQYQNQIMAVSYQIGSVMAVYERMLKSGREDDKAGF